MKNLQDTNSINYLNHVGLIHVTGEDAADFLQRQFTNDIEQVTKSKFGKGAYLTHQGRIIANFLIFRTNDGFLIAVSNTLVDALSKKLRFFVFRSRVVIDTEPDLIILGAIGGKAIENLLAVLNDSAPEGKKNVHLQHDRLVFAPTGPIPRLGLILSTSVADILQHLSAGSDSTDWERVDLLAGYPWITSQTSESLVAQAVNLDLVDSLSLTKGCYPGQEIVARLHYKRRVNRRMARAFSQTQVEPGTKVSSSVSAGKTGEVINSVKSKAGAITQLLVSLPVEFLSHETLSAADEVSISVLRDELPYEIPEATR